SRALRATERKGRRCARARPRGRRNRHRCRDHRRERPPAPRVGAAAAGTPSAQPARQIRGVDRPGRLVRGDPRSLPGDPPHGSALRRARLPDRLTVTVVDARTLQEARDASRSQLLIRLASVPINHTLVYPPINETARGNARNRNTRSTPRRAVTAPISTPPQLQIAERYHNRFPTISPTMSPPTAKTAAVATIRSRLLSPGPRSEKSKDNPTNPSASPTITPPIARSHRMRPECLGRSSAKAIIASPEFARLVPVVGVVGASL